MRGLFGGLARGAELKSFQYGDVEDLWRTLFAGGTSKAGPSVTWEKALKVTTCLACVRRIAEGVATVPVKLYRREPGTAKRAEARDHPAYELIATKPNDWQDSLVFREMSAFHVALAGNGYAYKNVVGGRLVELIPFEPGSVTPRQRRDYEVDYEVRLPDGRETLSQDEIWHVRGPSWNGVAGMDAVKLAREALGLAIATEESHANLHANGGRPSGILKFKHRLSGGSREQIQEAWDDVKRGGTALLDGDPSFESLMMNGVDAEHVALRRLEAEEICRSLGVMPIMVGIAEKTATYASSEQMFLAHLVHTVRPWHRRYEYSMDAQLLTEEERRDGYYFGFVDQEFLRAAAKDRAEYNRLSLGGGSNPGWRTPNEVRADDEQPPIGGGDHLYAPVNSGPIGPDGIPRAEKDGQTA